MRASEQTAAKQWLYGSGMPYGPKARNPATPYLVYEFSYNGKVFYIGICQGSTRHSHRWSFVKNLLRHHDAGTLKPAKATGLNCLSNRVITALIRAGLPEHTVTITWRGLGRASALQEEAKQMGERLAEGCLLANISGNPNKATVEQILKYLSVPKPA
jgi:hypothetical protein